MLDKTQLPASLLKYYNSTRSNVIRENIFDVFAYFKEIFDGLEESKIPLEDDVNSFFNSYTEEKKLPEYPEINKFLFSKKVREVKVAPKEVAILAPSSKEVVAKSEVLISDDEIMEIVADPKQLKSEINSIKENSKYYFQLYNQQLKLLREKQILVYAFSSSDILKIARDQIKILCENTEDFSNVYFDNKNKLFKMVSRKPCILEYNGDTKNFGYFSICIDINNSRTIIAPYLNNLLNEFNDGYHPHVYSGGDLCYGTAEDMIRESYVKFELAKVAEIANMIIHNYNKDSPVNDFNGFENMLNIRNITDFIEKKYLHKDCEALIQKKKAA